MTLVATPADVVAFATWTLMDARATVVAGAVVTGVVVAVVTGAAPGDCFVTDDQLRTATTTTTKRTTTTPALARSRWPTFCDCGSLWSPWSLLTALACQRSPPNARGAPKKRPILSDGHYLPVWRRWKRRRFVIVRSWVRVPPPALEIAGALCSRNDSSEWGQVALRKKIRWNAVCERKKEDFSNRGVSGICPPRKRHRSGDRRSHWCCVHRCGDVTCCCVHHANHWSALWQKFRVHGVYDQWIAIPIWPLYQCPYFIPDYCSRAVLLGCQADAAPLKSPRPCADRSATEGTLSVLSYRDTSRRNTLPSLYL